MLVETFIRKMLRLKAHRVTAVEMKAEQMVIRIDRLARRRLSCRGCGRPCGRIHQVEAARNWQHLSFWGVPVVLHYQPRRVRCPSCGVRREAVPWAGAWARITTALARAVAGLARNLSWQETARFFQLDWKSVASIVERVVAYGLERRRRHPLHILGIDDSHCRIQVSCY